jgi:hypothetical protein
MNERPWLSEFGECVYHRERLGESVPAVRLIGIANKEGMCQNCLNGKPTRKEEDRISERTSESHKTSAASPVMFDKATTSSGVRP